MAIWCLTGKPGNGKSTAATDRAINDYLRNGRRVVTNFHLDVAPVATNRHAPISNASIMVLPATPTPQDLADIGDGGPSEEEAGLLVLDETGRFLNSRGWQGNERQDFIEFFLQSRKHFWDIILIVQDVGLLDKQIRDAVVEMTARCRRSDRKKLWGFKFPRVHLSIIREGTNPTGMILDRWIYRGADAHKCFNSYHRFGTEEVAGLYSVIPPRLSKWRYIPKPPPLSFWFSLPARFAIWGLCRLFNSPPPTVRLSTAF